MPGPLPPPILSFAQWRQIPPPRGHHYVGANDPRPGAPAIRQWTPPTYYQVAYNAVFKGFGQNLPDPLVILERHYDPYTHKLIFEGKRFLYSPTLVYRPAGTYISIQAAAGAEIVDADKDFDGDGA